MHAIFVKVSKYIMAVKCLFNTFVMVRIISPIIYGMVLYILSSCFNKAKDLGSIETLQQGKNMSDTTMKTKINKPYSFIESIKPGETIVIEKRKQSAKSVEMRNTNIHAYFLLQSPLTKDGFLNTEIVNYTGDTILYVSDSFFYKKSNNSWVSLPYPNNYAKTDLGYSILSQKSIQLRLRLPFQENYNKGEYKLQLVFRNASQDTYYYIDKFFVIE